MTQFTRPEASFAAEMYLWLCNRPMPRLLGGPSWPIVSTVDLLLLVHDCVSRGELFRRQGFASYTNHVDTSYGFPAELEDGANTTAPHGTAAQATCGNNPPDSVFWGHRAGSSRLVPSPDEDKELREEVGELRKEVAAVRRDLAAVLAKL